jgi:hypothetical protein
MFQKSIALLIGAALVGSVALGSSAAVAHSNAKALLIRYSEPQRSLFTWVEIQALRAFARMP